MGRLKTLDKIKTALESRPAELEELRKNGKKIVGWLAYNISEELIYALGLVPVRLGQGGDGRLVEVGARHISTKNCVFVRQALGQFAEKTDPYIKQLDLVVVDATCIQIYRLEELINFYFGYKTLVLGVPRNFATSEGREYFRKEVEHFTKELEEFAGARLEPSKLDEAIKIYQGIRDAIKTLYKYQSQHDAPLSWREVFSVVHAGYYLDRQKYLELLQELVREVEENLPKQSERRAIEARIFLSGSLIAPGDTKLIDIIEQAGGKIVGDDLWSGLNFFIDLEVKEPTTDSVADAYLDRVPHASLPYLDLPSDRRLANLKNQIQQFGADGVIYHTLRYCDAFTFKAGETKNVLGNVPFMEIHTEYSGSDFEAIRTRVEAFVEMIKNKNELVEVTINVNGGR
ncbi:MAG: 2-hydroxyacyl-CoA dehydratase [Chlorobiales bacterium]|jgi:benzoyl-CoA reductase/2-hydroxyglutaryl-CoA dehydratase subunit BcrC/BadD/HgdB|nr:2-hydroxyacyl-CoA dehydratase [Chlorobiales bacterium]